ncbi:cell division protein FtsL [Candidatus Cloacimonadota bacterium]
MNKKFFLLILILFALVFSHFFNKHHIMIDSRKCDQLMQQLKSCREQNNVLINENRRLCSRERIQELAINQLGMSHPTDLNSTYTIKIDKEKNKFCLIDFIVPSVEALTQ